MNENIFSILEEIINEVSVGAWSRAAKSSLEKRKAAADTAHKQADYVRKNTSDNVKDYIKVGKEVTKKGTPKKKFKDSDYDYDAYDNSQKVVRSMDKKASKADERTQHAEKVQSLNLSDKSKQSTNRLIKAARNGMNSDSRYGRRGDRFRRAVEIAEVDPSRANRNKKDLEAKDKKDKEFVKAQFKKEPIYQKDEYTEKANSLDNNYGNVRATKQAHADHQNAMLNQGLRNKLEKAYKKANESLSEACVQDIFNKIERILWQD